MIKKFQKNITEWFCILVAPLIAYYPIVFLGYTTGRADIVIPGNSQVAWPVQDSYASALQDEAWLPLIKESLASGEIPLINMQNGLGAPLLESMQAGVFYILNPILLLFNTDAPVYFDLFALLHVYILIVGLSLLFSLFANKKIAIALAILLGLSGATYLNINMVHFRGFAWLPFMLYGAINIARGNKKFLKKSFILLCIATLASATSGSIQDFVMSFGVTVVVFGIEYIFSTKKSFKKILLFLSGMFSSAMVAMIALLPFFISKMDGNLFANVGAHRALQTVDLSYMSTWIIPKVKGLFPHQLFVTGPHQQIQPDFPTVAVFFVLLTIFIILARKKINKKIHVGVLTSFLVFSALALLKAAHLPIFDFIKHIPLFNSLKFAKYDLFVVLLLGMVAAAGLQYFSELTKKQRRIFSTNALIATAVVVGAVLLYFTQSPQIDFSIKLQEATKSELFRTHIVSALTLIFTTILLFWYPKRIWLYLTLIFIIHSAFIHPGGYYKRHAEYEPQFDRERIQLEMPRVLSSATHTNQSIFHNFESIGVWDAIFNESYRTFMMHHFEMNSPKLVIQPNFKDWLNKEQIDVMRLLGVNIIQGHSLQDGLHVEKIGSNIYQLNSPVPRIFALTSSEYDAFPQDLSLSSPAQTVNRVHSSNAPGITVTQINANSLEFKMEEDFRGVLVANQAYSTNWKFQNQSPEEFQNIFPAWDVSLTAGENYKISYWPRGLTYGIYCALIGFFIFTLTLLNFRRFE